MSPMWDDAPERQAGMCASCDTYAENGIVHTIPRMSGPDVRIVVHAVADECPSTTRRNTVAT